MLRKIFNTATEVAIALKYLKKTKEMGVPYDDARKAQDYFATRYTNFNKKAQNIPAFYVNILSNSLEDSLEAHEGVNGWEDYFEVMKEGIDDVLAIFEDDEKDGDNPLIQLSSNLYFFHEFWDNLGDKKKKCLDIFASDNDVKQLIIKKPLTNADIVNEALGKLKNDPNFKM